MLERFCYYRMLLVICEIVDVPVAGIVCVCVCGVFDQQTVLCSAAFGLAVRESAY